MDFGNEEATANYFITGLLATITANDLNALTTLVEVKKRLDDEIDYELERWADGLDADDE